LSDELQFLSEAIAESFAESLGREFNGTLLGTGLTPAELTESALCVFANKIPDFANASQESLQCFVCSLRVAIAERIQIESDLEILARSGLRPQ
jgi:hypothetical protein